MPGRKHVAFMVLVALLLCGGPLRAQDTAAAADLRLSPELMELLRAEMQALLGAVQSLPAAIATADWRQVADTGAQIRASYILDRQLSPAQRSELAAGLPEHFGRLDSAFHHEAAKLEKAALDHDAQLAAFHYYRLIETCTACHAIYASTRFPGFSSPAEHVHTH